MPVNDRVKTVCLNAAEAINLVSWSKTTSSHTYASTRKRTVGSDEEEAKQISRVAYIHMLRFLILINLLARTVYDVVQDVLIPSATPT